jgi:hypothetical protein
MSFLRLHVAEGRRLDQQAVTKGFLEMERATLMEPSRDCESTCYHEPENDFTVIRFKKDHKTIVINGSGEATLLRVL